MKGPLNFEQRLERWAETGAQWKAHTTEVRQWMAARTAWPVPCPRCGDPVPPTRWHLGHIHDQATHPHLRWDPGNWRIEHVKCNTSAGASAGNKRRNRIRNATENSLVGDSSGLPAVTPNCQ